MADPKVRAARGAIRVAEDATDSVLSSTERLLSAMLERNGVVGGDIVSVFFTATDDLRSAFPAEAARKMGLGHVPLLCAREIPVEGAMARVVRVLMHFYTDRPPDRVAHIYLDGAESLRDDLG
ncbi:MAG TPA: chorismate mutase [Actinomycetota bacterium]|nr:chorismate mutase [Actinomycetota bacterium]